MRPNVDRFHFVFKRFTGNFDSVGGVFFFNTGAGLALHDGDLDRDESNEKQLGSRLLFRIPFEVGLSWGGRHRLSLMFDHVSNAYLASPNEGLDTLGLRYGFQF